MEHIKFQFFAADILVLAAHAGGLIARRIKIGEVVGQIVGGIIVGSKLSPPISSQN